MSTEFLKLQMNRMRVNWRLSLDPESKRIQDAEFKPLLDQWGEAKFAATVQRCIREHANGFFPSVAEFERYECSGVSSIVTCPSCESDTGDSPRGYVMVKRTSRMGVEYECLTRCTHGRPA